MVKLTLKIKEWTYTKEIQLPTIEKPTIPQITFVPPPTLPKEVRIVKILPEKSIKLPDANEGETVKITASIHCKSDDIISKPRDTAYLIIDGAVADQKPITDGTVTFDYEATAVPINIHRICVKVNPTEACKSPGQDCKSLLVKSQIISPAEQLRKEREAEREQRRLIEEARQALREEIISGEAPTVTIPGAIIPSIVPTAAPPIEPSPEPTPPVTIPDTGTISIIGMPVNFSDLPVPIYLYIDDINKGRVYSIPKTVTDIQVGTHTIYLKAGELTSPSKTVYVTKDSETTVSI